jgi:hypothetical protein
MDDATEGAPAPRCPWCSAELAPGATTCPSCGATLTSAEGDPQIPGVTTVAATAAGAAVKAPKPNRLLRWISGEPSDDVVAPLPPPGSLEPPAADVRREIRRLELEAELTNLSAEASAIAADDALEARAANDVAGAEAALQVAHDARAVSEAIDRADAEAFGEAPVEPPVAAVAAGEGGGDAAPVTDDTPGASAAAEGPPEASEGDVSAENDPTA